jgi:hypothetical protein
MIKINQNQKGEEKMTNLEIITIEAIKKISEVHNTTSEMVIEAILQENGVVISEMKKLLKVGLDTIKEV